MHSRQLVRSQREFFGYGVSNKTYQGFKKPVVSGLLFVAKQNVNAGGGGVTAANLDMYCVQLIKLRRTNLKSSITKPNFAMTAKSI